MRAGIVTFHFVNNFGGALQAYALCRAIEDSCNIECVVVDYRSRFIQFTDAVRLFPITTNPAELHSGMATMGERRGRMQRFDEFAKQNLELTSLYHSNAALMKTPPACDVLVCGSDQIWNPIITAGVDDVYYLGFAGDGIRKVAYAPSFGGVALRERQQRKVERLIRRLDALSAREPDGVARLQAITGTQVSQLIDPTFLLSADAWGEVACKPCDVPDEFILLYIMQRDESVYEHVAELKKAVGLSVVEISRYGYRPDFVDQTLIDVGPAEYLWLFQHASKVCTNSFHGLAFSAIFQKPLHLVPSKRFGNRIAAMLDLLGKESELLRVDVRQQFTFEDVHTQVRLAEEREKSFEYLRQNIREQV